MIKARYLILAFIVVVLFFLIARFPISTAFSLLNIELPEGVAITKLEGTVWNSEAELQINQQPLQKIIRLNTGFKPLQLLTLNAGLSALVQTDDGSSFDCDLGYSLLGGQANIDDCHGTVTKLVLNDLLQEFKVNLSSPAIIEGLSVYYDTEDKTFTDASGLLQWDGGETQLNIQNRMTTETFKPMIISFSSQEGVLVGDIAASENSGVNLGGIRVDMNDQASIKILKGLFDYQGFEYPGNAKADKVVFETGYLLQ